MDDIIPDNAPASEADSADRLNSLQSPDQQSPNQQGSNKPGLTRRGTRPSAISWLGFNLVLFVLYVGFFHLCLVTQFPFSLAIGLAIAAAISYLCVRFYYLFTNRYEFLFYLSLPLDVALEGLIPFHSGYSFYWCAAAFWSVFGAYRIYRLVAKN